jgi:basic amino acid/polyamine antiporter, APA family
MKKLGTLSGVGLVLANMVGVGVLTTTGFMAGKLGPWAILGAWLVGGCLALAGARCYAELAAAVPRSGGEYRFLSDFFHPFLGYVAGWMSLLVGFSAPVALAASTAGPFFETLVPGTPPLAVGAALIALATLSQALDVRWSKLTQNVLAATKAVLLLGFIAAGLALGAHALPTWRPPHQDTGLPVGPFAVSLVYITFAFSGWNTAVYAAEEFREPRRTVPRAMLVGTALVAVAYMAVNWTFVANLSGERLAAWLREDTQRVTLAHVLVAELAGPRLGRLVSAFVVVALASSVTSMTFAGPRVYASMAREGFLPRSLAGRADRPPRGAVLLQSVLALALLLSHSFEELLSSVGSILTVGTGLTVAAVFRMRFGKRRAAGAVGRPGPVVLACAALYVAGSAWMLWHAFTSSRLTLVWLALVVLAAAVAYVLTRRRRAATPDAPPAEAPHPGPLPGRPGRG